MGRPVGRAGRLVGWGSRPTYPGAVMKHPIELLRSHARSTDGHSRLQLVATGQAILHPEHGVILPIVYESARLVVELVVMESADGAVLRREETERVCMPCRE